MTLVASVRCDDGIVIAADSQETITNSNGASFRRSVQKLSPFASPTIKTVMAGSGNGNLINTFIVRFRRHLEVTPISSLQHFVTEVEAELTRFYANDVALRPKDDDDNEIDLVIGAYVPATKEYNVWKSAYAALVPIEDQTPILAGWEEEIYYRTIGALCRGGMKLQQGVLAALYTLTVAEDTSNYVRGPMSVVIIHPGGIFEEPAHSVEVTVNRLKRYEQHLNELFLACADTSVSPRKLHALLEDFVATVAEVHTQEITNAVCQALVSKQPTGDSYAKVPPGTSLEARPDGKLDVVYDKDTEQESRQTITFTANLQQPQKNVP